MKRGPKSLLTPQLQKRLCDLLASANTIKTACDACGIGERTFHDWVQGKPAFAAATREARARAKIQLVDIIRTAALKNPFHAQWLLERSWPNEYARTERVEQIGEKADEKLSCNIFYETGGVPIHQLLDFPLETDSPEVADEKQRRLMGNTAPPPAEKISDEPPPKVVPKHLTGRIDPSWKGNGKA